MRLLDSACDYILDNLLLVAVGARSPAQALASKRQQLLPAFAEVPCPRRRRRRRAVLLMCQR